MSETILKGKINYYTYIWHTEKGACEKCQALDGLSFKNPDEIPDKPHPNCKCWIEVSEENGNKDDLCDCNERYLDELIYELEEGQGDAKSLAEDYEMLLSEINKTKNHFEEIIQDYKNMLNEVEDEINKHLEFCNNSYHYFKDFLVEKIDELSLKPQNIEELIKLIIVGGKVANRFVVEFLSLMTDAYILKRAGMDKYRHSVANCSGPQFGETGEKVATLLSDLKEHFDQWEDVYAKSHGVTIEEAKADSERDQVANRLGRLRGRENPNCDCRELMKDLIPESHRNKY